MGNRSYCVAFDPLRALCPPKGLPEDISRCIGHTANLSDRKANSSRVDGNLGRTLSSTLITSSVSCSRHVSFSFLPSAILITNHLILSFPFFPDLSSFALLRLPSEHAFVKCTYIACFPSSSLQNPFPLDGTYPRASPLALLLDLANTIPSMAVYRVWNNHPVDAVKNETSNYNT